MSNKTYKIDKAADYLKRIEIRMDDITSAEQALQAEFKKGSEDLGLTFAQDGVWYQLRNRKGKFYICVLPAAPKVFLRGPYTKKPRPADIAEVEDLGPSTETQVEVSLEVGKDLVGFDEGAAPTFLDPTSSSPAMAVIE